MAFINLLHNGYQGKLGETVGQKWKNQRTVRTYNPHNNSKSESQLKQRGFYKELITIASEAYPTRLNFPKSPIKTMNDFNYYTSLLYKIKNSMITGGRFYFIDNFKRGDICHPTTYLMNGGYYLFICVPDDVETVHIKDYKLVVIYNLNSLTGKYQQVEINLSYNGLVRQFKAGATTQQFKRGFLWKVDRFPAYRGVLYGAIARKKGYKWEYSGIFDLRNITRNDLANLEAAVPPLTVTS